MNSDQFGVTDDFFVIGGDSLNAAQIIHRVEKEFKVSLSLQDFYSNANVRDLKNHIDSLLADALVENADMLEILSQIEQMSESDVEEKLGKTLDQT